MNSVPDDYDPVPEHMREAWDKVHQALMSGKTLSEEELIALNAPLLEELKKTHTPEEIEEMKRLTEEIQDSDRPENPIFFEGHCPRCKLGGVQVDMLLNYDDLWECTKCHLQGHSASVGMFALMKPPGRGDFRSGNTLASDCAAGWVLTFCETDELEPISTHGFNGENELREFFQKPA